MAKDNELSVLRTSGVHAFRTILPVLVLGVFVSISSYIVNETIVLWSNHASDILIKKELRKTLLPR